jgi:FkbM family methyltransferase
MIPRTWIHAAGRVLTRGLLHASWRDYRPIASTYLHLYLFGKHLTDRYELAALRRLITSGMVIADIGANAGFYTLEMASMVGPAGRILAFEPDGFNFGLLRDRLRRSRVANVDAYQIALGDKPGRATLYCSAYHRADNRLHASHNKPHVEAYDVQVRTMDDIVLSGESPALDGIKMDVQGAEAHVLKGARAVLERGVQWIWIEFSPDHLRGAGTDPDQFLALLADLGMDIFEFDPAGCLKPFSPDGYSTRIGSGYGDLVLLARAAASRSAKAVALPDPTDTSS